MGTADRPDDLEGLDPAVLEALPPAAPPPGFASRVVEEWQREQARLPAPMIEVPPVRRQGRLALLWGLGAVVAVAVAVMVVLVQKPQGPVPVQPGERGGIGKTTVIEEDAPGAPEEPQPEPPRDLPAPPPAPLERLPKAPLPPLPPAPPEAVPAPPEPAPAPPEAVPASPEAVPAPPEAVPAPPAPAPVPPLAPGTLSRAEVMRVLRGHVGAFNSCVQEHLRREPDRTGTLELSFDVAGSGRADNLKIRTPKLAGSHAARCITKIIKGIRWPEFKGPPIAIPSMPFQIGEAQGGND